MDDCFEQCFMVVIFMLDAGDRTPFSQTPTVSFDVLDTEDGRELAFKCSLPESVPDNYRFDVKWYSDEVRVYEESGVTLKSAHTLHESDWTATLSDEPKLGYNVSFYN